MFTYQKRRHYTGTMITEFGFELFGFGLFDYWHSREGKHSGMIRLSFLTAVMFGLFYGKCNYLQGYGGCELWAGTLRYCPKLLRWLFTWAIGYSNSKQYAHYSGRSRYVVHRFGKLAFCSCKDRPEPDVYPRDDEPGWAGYDEYGFEGYIPDFPEDQDFDEIADNTVDSPEEQEYYDKMAARLYAEEEEKKSQGLTKCIECGTWVKPDEIHYPNNDPEYGPAHYPYEKNLHGC